MRRIIRLFLIALVTGMGSLLPQATQTPENIIGWKSAEALTLAFGPQWVGGTSFDNQAFYEFTLLKIGTGFAPPVGLGLWGRLWTGDMSYADPVASLRLSYTPFIMWKIHKGNYLRYARFDLFLEPGYMFVWTREPLWRTGVSGSIDIPPYFFPLTLEGGWIIRDYFEHSGFYFNASASMAGLEQPIIRSKPSDFFVTHQFSPVNDHLYAWAGLELLGIGRLAPDSSYYLRHPVDDVELCLIKAGFGLTPPAGVGLEARIWAGALSDWWWEMPYFSIRLNYSPLVIFSESGLGCYRVARLDIFAERGFVQDNKYTFRTGISTDLSFNPWLAPVTVEAGWAEFPLWSSYTSGFYLLITISALGGEYRL